MSQFRWKDKNSGVRSALIEAGVFCQPAKNTNPVRARMAQKDLLYTSSRWKSVMAAGGSALQSKSEV